MPAKTTSFILGDHFEQFISAQIGSGRFSSASDVVRAALRMMEDYETKRAVLEAALDEGERSGVAENYSINGVLAKLGLAPR